MLNAQLPTNIAELQQMVGFFARNNWYKGYIELSDILVNSLSHDNYPPELLEEIVIVYAEEWLHSLQEQQGKTLTDQTDHELDVAKYMLNKGVKLTNDYLLRYDRGRRLGLIDDVDDSLTDRPTFRKGVFVRYNNNSDWQLVGYDSQKAIIRSTIDPKKEASIELQELIERQNNKAGVYPFKDLTTESELFDRLKAMKNIYGGFEDKGSYTADEIIDLIKKVKDPDDLKSIPRAGGLRQKVAILKNLLSSPGLRTTSIGDIVN